MDLMHLIGIGGDSNAPSSVLKQPGVVQRQLKDGLRESQLTPASEAFILLGALVPPH